MPPGYLSKMNATMGITRQQGVRSLLYRHSSASLSSLCSTSTSKSVLEDVWVDDIYTSCSDKLDFEKPVAFHFGDRTRKGYLRAHLNLKRKHSLNSALNFRHLAPDGISSFPHPPWLMNFSSTFSTSYCRPAYNLSFDRDPWDVLLENSTVDPTIDDGDTLKLVSGSSYIPHPHKEETGGEDAHFICADEQAFGVADGVGGWAEVGVNAGLFSRELMSNSVRAIQEEPKGSISPLRVLEKAHSATTAQGSSTACIIALAEKELHAINLGDSGFVVIRNGRTVFRSAFQQHNFNLTYQLESGNGADLPSSGEVYTVPVAKGDVVVAATDGLFDNLYANEVTSIIVHATRVGLEPQAAAQKIAALARHRAHDKNRMTPFSAAAQQAGIRYFGGKLDDITVVVSYITSANSRVHSHHAFALP